MADLGSTKIYGDLIITNDFKCFGIKRLDDTSVVYEDRIITAGSGMTGGGNLSNNITISHADTSSQTSSSNSGRKFIQSITLDGFGHITAIGTATDSDTYVGTLTNVSGTAPVVSSGGTTPVISMAAATASVDGYMSKAYASKLNGIATSANNYSHPTYTARSESGDTGALTGATVISDLDFNMTSDTSGHITAFDITTLSTRNLTLGDLGYTGATNANYFTYTNAQAVSAVNAQTSMSINISGSSASCTGLAASASTSAALTGAQATAIATNTNKVSNIKQTITNGNGMNFTSGNGNVTITLGTPSTLTASTSDGVSTSSHAHKITNTNTGAASTIVSTDSSGGITATAGSGFNMGTAASMVYNAVSKTIDFNFA